MKPYRPESGFETNNEVVTEWVDNKLRDACRCIGIFCNYLFVPRSGYIQYTSKIPTIPLPVVKYVIEDLFNCGIVSSYTHLNSYPESFALTTRRFIREFSDTNVIVTDIVIDYLWRYIQIGVINLTKNISLRNEIKVIQDVRIRDVLIRKKKSMEDFNNSTKTEIDKQEFMSYKATMYNDLKTKIKNAIHNSNIYLDKYEKDPDFHTNTVVVLFTTEERDLLSELGVSLKRFRRMNEYSVYERKLNRKENNEYIGAYNENMKTIIRLQQATLEQILGAIESSDLNEQLEKLQNKNPTKQDVDLFIRKVNISMKKAIEEIENDDSILISAKQRVLNEIKKRISVYQTYVSNKSCDTKLDRDVDGCILQSIFYLSVSLTDWFELESIGKEEIKYAMRILLPEEINISSSGSRNEEFIEEMVKLLKKHEMSLQQNGHEQLEIFFDTIKHVESMNSSSPEYEKFNNRVRYFSNQFSEEDIVPSIEIKEEPKNKMVPRMPIKYVNRETHDF